MKLFFFGLLSFLCVRSSGTGYYFASAGNDANPGTISAPFKTITKLNSILLTSNPGDIFYFNSGDIFYGKINVSNSGSSGNPIVFTSYGTGSKPVITGFVQPSSWTNLGKNIWESNIISTLPYTNLITVNGINTAMGHYPNSLANYTNAIGKPAYSITSVNDLTTDWTGAELMCYINSYTIGRNPILSQTGNTINFQHNNVDPTNFQNAYADFVRRFQIQNDIRTLDMPNEWYYNPVTGKLDIYETSSPASLNINVPTIDTVIYLNRKNYINFTNLSFTGANSTAIELSRSSYIDINGCDFNFSGKNHIHALFASGNSYLTISNCTGNNSNNEGFDGGKARNSIITGCTVKNCGMLIGMMQPGGSNARGIALEGDYATATYNSTDSTGYIGMNFYGNYNNFSYNHINHFCMNFKDGGGLYTVADYSLAIFTGTRVSYNIVENSGSSSSQGIYFDGSSNGIEADHNTVSNVGRGIYLHNNFNDNIHDNLLYNCTQGCINISNDVPNKPLHDITVKNNVMFSTSSTFPCSHYAWVGPGFPPNFILDSNRYVRPLNDNQIIETNIKDEALKDHYAHLTLSDWRSLSNSDANSIGTPSKANDASNFILISNPTNVPQPYPVSANSVNAVKGINSMMSNGSLSIPPYQSIALIKNGNTYTPLINNK